MGNIVSWYKIKEAGAAVARTVGVGLLTAVGAEGLRYGLDQLSYHWHAAQIPGWEKVATAAASLWFLGEIGYAAKEYVKDKSATTHYTVKPSSLGEVNEKLEGIVERSQKEIGKTNPELLDSFNNFAKDMLAAYVGNEEGIPMLISGAGKAIGGTEALFSTSSTQASGYKVEIGVKKGELTKGVPAQPATGTTAAVPAQPGKAIVYMKAWEKGRLGLFTKETYYRKFELGNNGEYAEVDLTTLI